MMKKILIGLLLVIVIAVAGFVLFVSTSEPKNYNDEYPVSDLTVEADSARIARGKYLVYGPAHCGHCHVPFEKLGALEAGEEVPLTGGFGLEIPPGTFNAPNITTHEMGIGRLSDGEIYRMLRYNIRPNGHAAFDFMPFSNMTDEDIYSIISFLRTLPAEESENKQSEYSFLGKMIVAMGAIKPAVPDANIPQSIAPSISVEYGKYLAYAVANCRGCHSNRDMKTGEYIGEDYAGGLVFGPDNLTDGWIFTTPNLTNDPESGIMYGWSEEDFIARMRQGRVHANSPMPWAAVQHMDEGDLRAVYRFLMSVPPVKNEIAAIVTPPEE